MRSGTFTGRKPVRPQAPEGAAAKPAGSKAGKLGGSFERKGPPRGDGGERRSSERRGAAGDERRPFKTREDARGERGNFERRGTAGDERKPTPVLADAPKRDHAPRDGLVRLSKVMSELGLCSRREADEWIQKGWVRVDGEIVDTLGTRIRPTQEIEILPAAHSAQAKQVMILLHKPVGYVSGQAEDGYEPAVVLINPSNH